MSLQFPMADHRSVPDGTNIKRYSGRRKSKGSADISTSKFLGLLSLELFDGELWLIMPKLSGKTKNNSNILVGSMSSRLDVTVAYQSSSRKTLSHQQVMYGIYSRLPSDLQIQYANRLDDLERLLANWILRTASKEFGLSAANKRDKRRKFVNPKQKNSYNRAVKKYGNKRKKIMKSVAYV